MVSNGDLLTGPAMPGPIVLHGSHSAMALIGAFFHLVEDHMLAVQPLGLVQV